MVKHRETDDHDRVKCWCWPRSDQALANYLVCLGETIAVDYGNHTETEGPRFGKVLGAH